MTRNYEVQYGSLNLILGCMFSGKTSNLITRYNRYTIGGKKCIMVKYKADIRYDKKKVVTHDGIKITAIICEYLYEIDSIINKYDVICIDEIQFYKDAHIFCDKWATAGKIVEVCGLNGTYERKQFNIISKLIPKADSITYLTAICRENGNEAKYSKRLSDETEEQVIGGIDKYIAVDRMTYYNEYNIKQDNIEKFKDFLNIYVTQCRIMLDEQVKQNCMKNLMDKLNKATNDIKYKEIIDECLEKN